MFIGSHKIQPDTGYCPVGVCTENRSDMQHRYRVYVHVCARACGERVSWERFKKGRWAANKRMVGEGKKLPDKKDHMYRESKARKNIGKDL